MLHIYSKNDCVQCNMTKKLFKSANIPFSEINIDEKPEYIPILKDKGFSSAPVVEIEENDQIIDSWAGFNPKKVKTYIQNYNN